MTREPCEYCGQEDRYGHNAICVMNTVEELRAEIERLKAALTGAETVMMIVEPRSHKAEYLAALTAIKAALKP